MRTPRRYHHGYVLDGLSWRRCLKGLVALALFASCTEGVQRTYDVCFRTFGAAQVESSKLQRLSAVRGELQAAERARVYYQSDAGTVAAARPYGYGFPGERRVMFQPPARRTTQ
ncbi:MAG: hypothetical protein HZB16_12190 [Armatimonadetes bacterium]|nr:hypothetical protein [Armatimonadota bacterium]